ncbi:unnamed protein product [Prorocentrum cordatum]|uniref:Glycerophosphocholine acyltransferase 1 n=1 Tax=Prorocentrum cordatum TaxID=2364126 RepID=A0ABN9VBI8_9DINO|nr:unnamed protein product [Polarella glacialis]
MSAKNNPHLRRRRCSRRRPRHHHAQHHHQKKFWLEDTPTRAESPLRKRAMTDSDDKLARVPIIQSDDPDVESVAWLLLTIAPHCCATAGEARKQRWLLRTAQSLVAICLYAASMWIQQLTQQVWLDFALVFIFIPPCITEWCR